MRNKHIEPFYIKKLTNLKYPQILNSYNITDKSVFKLIELYRKELTFDDLFEILEYKQLHYISGFDQTRFIIEILNNCFDLNLKLDNKRLESLYDILSPKIAIYDFKKFIENICDDKEIFSSGDLKNPRTLTDLINCRSYKIYSITN